MDWPTNTGEFRLGDFHVQSGEVIRDARIVWKSYGTLSPQKRQRGALSVELCRPAQRYGMADQARRHSRSHPMVRDHSEHVVKRTVLRRRRDAGLSKARHLMGQCAGATPPAHRTVRHREAARGLRVLHGRAAGLPLGRDISGRRCAHRRVCAAARARPSTTRFSFPDCCAP